MTNFTDVGHFHGKFDLPRVNEHMVCHLPDCVHRQVMPGPREMPDGLLDFRLEFLREELRELIQGVEEGDIAQQADALVDLVYVAMGTAHLLGLPWQELWDDVQAANMRKVRAQPDGSDSKRDSPFDVVKPEGWVGPDTWGVLERHGWQPPERCFGCGELADAGPHGPGACV